MNQSDDDYEVPLTHEENSRNEELMRNVLADRTVNEEDFKNLPEELREIFQKMYRLKSEMKREKQQKEEEKKEFMRRQEVEAKEKAVKRILKKLKLGREITAEEQELLDEHGHKVTSIESPEVDLNPLDLLTDIVNGDYTLQDLHSIREGDKAAAEKEAVENSPLQFFDDIVENVKVQTHEALHTKEPGHFFGSLEYEQLSEGPMTGTITDAINNAATAIDLVHGNGIETNEAQAACESYVKALAMNEAEMKLKQLREFSINKQSNQPIAELTDAAADMDIDHHPKRPIAPRDQKLSFNITELNCDISFLPSDDPNVYKPLEIISYIGLTKKTS